MKDALIVQHPTRAIRVVLAGLLVAAVAAAPVAHAHPSGAGHSGGSIAIRLGEAPDCLDPQKTGLASSNIIDQSIFDGLTSQDAHLNVRPNLATSWQFSHGGTWVTFHLRHGVRFSNGDPLTAADVKWTFDRAQNPATKSAVSASLLAGVKQTQVIDPYTVRLILSAPYRPLLENLVNGYLGILDQKAVKAAGDNECQMPVGTGPYMITNVGPAFSTVTLSRNPYHTWAPPWAQNQGSAYLDTITYKSISSDSTTVSELLSGGLDFTDVAATQLPRVKGNTKLTLIKNLAQGQVYLGFNTAHAPFNTVAARRAIAQAIDRAQLIAIAYQGQAAPAYGPLPSTVPDYDPKAPSYAVKTDLAAAKAYFSAHPISTPLTLLTVTDPAILVAAQYIQAQLQQVGVKVNIVPKAIGDMLPLATKGQYDITIFGWTYSDPDVLYLLFHSSQEVNGGLNITFYKNATLDKLLTAGREATDPASAARIYAQAQRLITTQVVIDPLVTPIVTYAFTKRVHGYVVIPGEPLFYWTQDLYVTA